MAFDERCHLNNRQKVDNDDKKADHDLDAQEDQFSLERFRQAYEVVRDSATWRKLYKRTPLLAHWKDTGDLKMLSNQCDIYMKLENTQVTGKTID